MFASTFITLIVVVFEHLRWIHCDDQFYNVHRSLTRYNTYRNDTANQIYYKFSVYQLCSLSYKPMKMLEDVETDAILRYSTYLDVLCFDWRIASICFGENYDRSKITNKNLFVNWDWNVKLSNQNTEMIWIRLRTNFIQSNVKLKLLKIHNRHTNAQYL